MAMMVFQIYLGRNRFAFSFFLFESIRVMSSFYFSAFLVFDVRYVVCVDSNLSPFFYRDNLIS